MVRREDFIDGEVYEHSNTNIFKWDSNLKGSIYYINNNRTTFNKSSGSLYFTQTDAVRVAPDIDKKWLEACILANKTIPLEEIIKQNQTYEIY